MKKKQGNKYKCRNCVNMNKELFGYIAKNTEDSWDQPKEIEQ